jgi:hypothetical protein
MKNLLILILLFISISIFAVDNYRGNCINLDGEWDYVQMVQGGIIPSGGPFTVSVWAKADLNLPYDIREIVSQGMSAAGQNFYIGYSWDGWGLKIRVGDDWQTTNISFPTDNQWHYYTVTKDWSNTWLYIDGVEVAEKGSPISNPDGYFRIGKQYGGYGEYFHGQVDEVRIWDSCLTVEEINNTMNITLSESEPNLQHYYQLNGGVGDAVGISGGILYSHDPNQVWVGSTVPFQPAIISTGVSAITSESAVCGGHVYNGGGISVDSRGICWGTTPNPTIADLHTSAGTGTGAFTAAVTGLSPGTLYHFRAYAINDVGTSYGNDLAFTTVPHAPTNIDISVTGSTLTISWDSVFGATSYKVYSSSDPYGTFSEDTTGAFFYEGWTAPIGTSMKYYYVKAVN